MRITGARVFWTRSQWRDAAALRRFMASGGGHRTAMARLPRWWRLCRTERTSGPLKPGWSEAPYFAVLAVASISIIKPGQASAVMTTNVPAGCVTPPNSSVLHLPAGKK